MSYQLFYIITDYLLLAGRLYFEDVRKRRERIFFLCSQEKWKWELEGKTKAIILLRMRLISSFNPYRTNVENRVSS